MSGGYRKGAGLATDYFLKLAGIKGESSDAKHKDEIELVSFSWGVSQSAAQGGGGGGGGKAEFTDFQVVSRVSKSSPLLFLACATGQHIKDATLAVRKAGGDQLEYLTIKLSDVLVSSYQEAGGGGDDERPLDVVSFDFAKVEISYSPQRPDGKLDSPVKAGYDLKQSKKI